MLLTIALRFIFFIAILFLSFIGQYFATLSAALFSFPLLITIYYEPKAMLPMPLPYNLCYCVYLITVREE
jgi:hypothetical protein